jgi:Putative alpha-1,2-mannosidase
LGFYSVTPASTQYVIGVPLFKKAEITFENGKKLQIVAPNNSPENRFVQSITINGKISTKNYFEHFELQKGGTIEFKLGAQPNKQRGTKKSDFPFSMSLQP